MDTWVCWSGFTGLLVVLVPNEKVEMAEAFALTPLEASIVVFRAGSKATEMSLGLILALGRWVTERFFA